LALKVIPVDNRVEADGTITSGTYYEPYSTSINMTPEIARAAKSKMALKKGIIPDHVVKQIQDTVDQVRNSIADSIAVKKSTLSPIDPSKSTQNPPAG